MSSLEIVTKVLRHLMFLGDYFEIFTKSKRSRFNITHGSNIVFTHSSKPKKLSETIVADFFY